MPWFDYCFEFPISMSGEIDGSDELAIVAYAEVTAEVWVIFDGYEVAGDGSYAGPDFYVEIAELRADTFRNGRDLYLKKGTPEWREVEAYLRSHHGSSLDEQAALEVRRAA